MKTLVCLISMTLGPLAFASSEWKIIAQTKNCIEKVQVLAKEGEKYVLAVHDGKKQKLFQRMPRPIKLIIWMP
jgi:hypothetical protein